MMQTLVIFDSTIIKTRRWLEHLSELMGGTELSESYMLLRSVLHAVRDRLIPEEAVQLGAQLPMLVRGFYYEGWNPTGKPLKYRNKDQFLEQIDSELRGVSASGLERGVTAVFALLSQEMAGGELAQVRKALPPELRELWPLPGM